MAEPRSGTGGPVGAVGGDRTGELVHREAVCSVRRFDPADASRRPVLLVYAVFNRPSVLDLAPGRSVLETLLSAGHPVYLVDWGRPTRLDGSLDLDDYAGRFLPAAIGAARADADGRRPHLLGYSTGGTLAAIAASRAPSAVASMTALAAPIDMAVSGGLYDVLRASDVPERLVDGHRPVPGELIAVGFSTAAPYDFHLGRYLRLAAATDADERAAMGSRLAWGFDPVDVPNGLLVDLLAAFRDDGLARGTLDVDGRPVDLGAIDVPTAVAVGTEDRFVPPASTAALLDLVDADATARFELPTGHLGLVSEAAAFERLWPEVVRFLAAVDRGRTNA